MTGDGNADLKTRAVRNNNTWLPDASGDGKYGVGNLSSTFGKAGDKYVTGTWI